MPRIHPLFPAVAAGLLLAVSPANASGRFELQSRKLEAPEMGTITQWMLRTDDGFFGFMPPRGASLETDAERRVLRIRPPGQPDILVTILPDAALAAGELDRKALKELALRDLPMCHVTDQGAFHTESERGLFFELTSTRDAGDATVTRIGYARISGVLFEFRTTCTVREARSAFRVFQDLLTSFQALGPASPKA